VLEEYGVWKCIYGHLHGQVAFGRGIKGEVRGVQYQMVSLDYLGARPKLIYDTTAE
jgi:predicted phosphohydrolase